MQQNVIANIIYLFVWDFERVIIIVYHRTNICDIYQALLFHFSLFRLILISLLFTIILFIPIFAFVYE